MLNPYYFTDKNLKNGFKFKLDSHHTNHANFNITIIRNYPEFGIDVRYNIKINKELSVFYARIINHYNFGCEKVFSARFDEQDEDNQVLDEPELFINLKINHKFTETDINKVDIKYPLEYQIQQQEMKESGWRFDKIISMTKYFLKNWRTEWFKL